MYMYVCIYTGVCDTRVWKDSLEGKVCKLKYRFYLRTHGGRIFCALDQARILGFSLLSVNGIRMKTYLAIKLAIKLLVWRCVLSYE